MSSRSFQNLSLTGDLSLEAPLAQIINKGLPLSFPDTTSGASGDIPSVDSTATITNKILNDSSNTVGANVLRNGNTWVLPLTGPSPVEGQTLKVIGGSIVWANDNGDITATVTTAGATTTPLYTQAVPINSVTTVRAIISAYDATTVANNASLTITGAFSSNGAGVVTQIGGTDLLYFGPLIPPLNPLKASFSTSVGNVIVNVTGVAAQSVTWTGRIVVTISP